MTLTQRHQELIMTHYKHWTDVQKVKKRTIKHMKDAPRAPKRLRPIIDLNIYIGK